MTRILRCAVALLSVTSMCSAATLESDTKQFLVSLYGQTHQMTPADSAGLERQLDQLAARASNEDRIDLFVDLQIAKATILKSWRGDLIGARAMLLGVIGSYDSAPSVILRKAYVLLAEVCADQGDEAAIDQLIERYRSSRHMDTQTYGYEVGEGRDTPITVQRPSGPAQGSTVITAMKTSRKQAGFAPGKAAPEFEATDIYGNPVRLADFRGKTVLLDFYQPQWTAWKRELPFLVSTYKSHQGLGFEILGIALTRDADAIASFTKGKGITWQQIAGDPAVTGPYAVYGEAMNFLVGPDGRLLGRNLHGAALAAALERVLSQ